jgi:nanoRNase/pAp phosphatase (c-di-AMP/oligoRNAs hydrolase)
MARGIALKAAECQRARGAPQTRFPHWSLGCILRTLDRKRHFLIVGHQNPDEDCIASMVAFGLLVSKFNKHAEIYIPKDVHEHYQYLLQICRYNAIRVVQGDAKVRLPIDVVVACDTPKPTMLEVNPTIRAAMERERVTVIEIDHHMGGDSELIGEAGFCLVTEASSSAELVGQLVLKLRGRPRLIKKYGLGDPLSRNLVLAILTGIIGDTKMGQFLKSRREEHYYRMFSGMFDAFLTQRTTKSTNIANMEQVFLEIQKLSVIEERCYAYFKEQSRIADSVGVVAVDCDRAESLYREFDRDVVVSVARTMADELAEKGGKVSLVAYCDDPKSSTLIQFRMRRSRDFRGIDLRDLLPLLGITNGGGHEGAIGFRVERDQVPDLGAFVDRILDTLHQQIG